MEEFEIISDRSKSTQSLIKNNTFYSLKSLLKKTFPIFLLIVLLLVILILLLNLYLNSQIFLILKENKVSNREDKSIENLPENMKLIVTTAGETKVSEAPINASFPTETSQYSKTSENTMETHASTNLIEPDTSTIKTTSLENNSTGISQTFSKYSDIKDETMETTEPHNETQQFIEVTTEIPTTTSISFLKKMSLAQNVSIEYLKKNGMHLLYQRYYSAFITTEELTLLKQHSCNQASILCIGGGSINSKFDGKYYIDLISCGDCFSILKSTKLNKPRFINGAYWYFTPGFSLGFSPSPDIIQQRMDILKLATDQMRLSWKIDHSSGGRLGTLKIDSNKEYYKYILVN